jgi:hypothetical protein
MSKIYYNLIKAGQWSIENVPTKNNWLADTQALLNNDLDSAE